VRLQDAGWHKQDVLSVFALAERIAFWIIHGREMEEGDAKAPKNK